MKLIAQNNLYHGSKVFHPLKVKYFDLKSWHIFYLALALTLAIGLANGSTLQVPGLKLLTDQVVNFGIIGAKHFQTVAMGLA